MYDLDGHLEMQYEDYVSGTGVFDPDDYFDDTETYLAYFDDDYPQTPVNDPVFGEW